MTAVRGMMLIRPLALALVLLLAGCATTGPSRIQTALQQLDAVWTAENAAARRRLGEHVVSATPDQAGRAARQAFAKLGMTVSPSAQAGVVSASRLYPRPGFSWTPDIRAREEPQARRILSESLGPLAALIPTRSADEVVTATISLALAGPGQTSVTADFRGVYPGEDCSRGCVTAMPPTAYRQAQETFWPVFRAELQSVVVADRAARKPPAARAKRDVPAARARPSSGWVRPSSGWKPPPKPKK